MMQCDGDLRSKAIHTNTTGHESIQKVAKECRLWNARMQSEKVVMTVITCVAKRNHSVVHILFGFTLKWNALSYFLGSRILR